jgi:heme exporter protein C
MSGAFRFFPVLAGATAVMLAVSLYLAFFFAPVEAEMGMVQKIFYFHVPSAIGCYAGFFMSFLFSVIYLLRPGDRVDAMARCGAEVGVVFCAMVLTSGPLWARPVWGTYFIFDPQLTATLLLFLIYSAYLLLRAVAAESPRIKKIGAALAIFGFIDVPIIHVAVKKWGGTHPMVEREGGGGLHPDMRVAFYVAMLTFLLLFATMYWLRVRVASQQDRLLDLELELDDKLLELDEIKGRVA